MKTDSFAGNPAGIYVPTPKHHHAARPEDWRDHDAMQLVARTVHTARAWGIPVAFGMTTAPHHDDDSPVTVAIHAPNPQRLTVTRRFAREQLGADLPTEPPPRFTTLERNPEQHAAYPARHAVTQAREQGIPIDYVRSGIAGQTDDSPVTVVVHTDPKQTFTLTVAQVRDHLGYTFP